MDCCCQWQRAILLLSTQADIVDVVVVVVEGRCMAAIT
jgi:hypothetical protein